MEGTTMSELRRIMMMFPRPEGSTPVTVDGYVAFLSDFSDMVSGSRIATDGSVETLSGWSISGYIEIPDDARYVYYDEDIHDQYTGLYDSSKTYIGHITKGNAVSLSAKYLRVSMPTDNISDEIIVILKEQREKPTVLPYDAQVEYLQSSGTQYINTNINPNSTTIFIIDGRYAITGQANVNNGMMVSDNERFHIGVFSKYFHFGLKNKWKNVVSQDSLRHIFELYGNGIAKIDGTSYTISTSSITAQTNPLYLFARNDISSVRSYTNGLEIYTCKIYNDGILVRDFIPVRKDSVGYLYDKVSGELFGNSGTGSFTYGNDVTN